MNVAGTQGKGQEIKQTDQEHENELKSKEEEWNIRGRQW